MNRSPEFSTVPSLAQYQEELVDAFIETKLVKYAANNWELDFAEETIKLEPKNIWETHKNGKLDIENVSFDKVVDRIVDRIRLDAQTGVSGGFLMTRDGETYSSIFSFIRTQTDRL